MFAEDSRWHRLVNGTSTATTWSAWQMYVNTDIKVLELNLKSGLVGFDLAPQAEVDIVTPAVQRRP